MIRGIKFASIPVRDQEQSLKFFTEKLGFRVMTDQPFGDQRWIELGIPGAESGLALFTPKGHEDRIGGFQPISFWTDDVFATAKILKSKGVEFAVEPKERALGQHIHFQRRGRQSICSFQQVKDGVCGAGAPARENLAVKTIASRQLPAAK